MTRVLITGGSGVLGSALSKLFLNMDCQVTVVDIIRRDECWRLQRLEVIDQLDYVWKASQDLSTKDLNNIDLVVDCAIGFPDRPFGTSSPLFTTAANIGPAMGLLEAARKLKSPPLMIYPSSFNALYGSTGIFSETTPVNPTTVYGWTKASVEQLYRMYHTSFEIPIIVTRVGSSYGEMMRSDEIVAKLIMAKLKQERFKLKSPHSKRMWTYLGDVTDAYRAIAEKTDFGNDFSILEKLHAKDFVLNLAGNKDDLVIDNLQLSNMISDMAGNHIALEESEIYEVGEIVNGNPVDFQLDARFTRELLGWKPKIALEDGLNRTLDWFNNRLSLVKN